MNNPNHAKTFDEWASENGLDLSPRTLICPEMGYRSDRTELAAAAWCAACVSMMNWMKGSAACIDIRGIDPEA